MHEWKNWYDRGLGMSSFDTERRVTICRGLAGLLALLVAWIHVLHPRLGAGRLFLYLEVGTLYDPRPLLFVLSAFLIFVGLGLGLLDLWRRAVYIGGVVLMVCYLLGYAAWHTILDHGAFWPHIEAHGHNHAGPLEILVIHLQTDMIGMISKVTEVLLLVTLIVLLYWDRSGDRVRG